VIQYRHNAMIPMKEIKHLAELSRLSIPEESLDDFAKELDSILTYISQIESLTIPAEVSSTSPVLHNVFRDDENPLVPGTHTEVITEAFPAREGEALSVKQIITHE